MIKCLKIKKVAIFLILFILILCLNSVKLNNNFSLISFAQETGEIIETIETPEKPPAEETIKTENIKETETEEELDLSLKADYISYEKIEEEDLVIAKGGALLKYQDIEVTADYLKINLTTHLLFASDKVLFKQDKTETYCE